MKKILAILILSLMAIAPLLAKKYETFSVYLLMIKNKNDFDDQDMNILKLHDNNGRTIAHALARESSMWLPYKGTLLNTINTEVLKFADNNGITVAHVLARTRMGWNTEDFSILQLKSIDGVIIL